VEELGKGLSGPIDRREQPLREGSQQVGVLRRPWSEAEPAIADHLGSHALQDLAGVVLRQEGCIVGMGVDIDEPRRKGEPARVQHVPRAVVVAGGPYLLDRALRNVDVCGSGSGTGSVQNLGAGDDESLWHRYLQFETLLLESGRTDMQWLLPAKHLSECALEFFC